MKSSRSMSLSRQRPAGSGRLSFALTVLMALLFTGLATSHLADSQKVSAQDGAVSPAANLYTVNTTSDAPGTKTDPVNCTQHGFRCTLRGAIEIANAAGGDNTIRFDIPTTDPGHINGTWTIKLTSALPALNTNINLQGLGADQLRVQTLILPPTPGFRVFTVTTSGVVTISGVTAAFGFPDMDLRGGAILNFGSGTVNISDCTLDSNAFPGPGDGGGIYNNTGTVNVTNSTIKGNFATHGGAIYNNGGTVTVTGSTLSGNNGTEGGGIYDFGGTVAISNSTLVDNHTPATGGSGGGIFNTGGSTTIGTVSVTNSTISGNSAFGGGGIFNTNNGTANNATIFITNSTITGNSASNAGGMANFGNAPVKSTIIALNTGGSFSPDVKGPFNSQGFNLIGKADGSTGFSVATDQKGTIASPLDPKLDPAGLQNNGGPTQTIALIFGSPAIDKGTSAGLTGTLFTDQRGSGFPRTINDPFVAEAAGGDGTDIGAFELQTAGPVPNAVQFNSSSYAVVEDCTTVTVTVIRIGDTSGAATVDYSTADVTASARRDYITALGKLSFAPGETSKSFAVLINEDSYVEGTETFNVNLSNPSGVGLGAPAIAAVQINDDPTEPATNVIDDPQNFVCQHYHDFLNRAPDSSGLAFWTNEITSCGSDQSCIETKRINVSAAFYLSIEFQQTGYLVERIYKASYASASATSTLGGTHQLPAPIVRLDEFLSDTQRIGQGVVVGQPGWETVLENNKQAFTSEFVQRSRFTTAFPQSMTPAQFVDTLNANAGNPLSPTERDQWVNDLSSNVKTRAQALRAVAEDSDLNNAEFNRAFVLMQFFGYLRRNPNDPQDTDYTGYDFWLTKLNQFNGNFQNAEMVKAFITSGEYRQRFGP